METDRNRKRRGEQDMRGLGYYLLESLPEESREKLLRNVVYTTIPAGRYIFQEGQPADYICILREGKVKLSHIDPDGRESIVMLLSENDTIWESLFLYDGRFPYSAVTLTKTRLCRIYKENFIHILDDPRAALEIVTMLSRKLHDANERNQLLAVQDPEARVAGFLIYHRERSGEDLLNYRLEEIAASVGLRPETVSRKLGQLQKEGLVERAGKGKIRIRDLSGLAARYRGEIRDAE